MSMPTTEKMRVQIGKFASHPVLLTLPEEVQREDGVPDAWIEMLRRQNKGIKSWVEPWEAYRSLLPGVYDFLERKVRGACVLREDRKPPSLLYVYTSESKDYFHRGWPALGDRVPAGKEEIWARLPQRLQEFYSGLHNGWTHLSSDSMGPLPVQDIEFLSDYEWDAEPDALSRLPFRLEEVIMVFSNGGGDSLCLDLEKTPVEDHALSWWHVEPLEPDLDQNFWARMDDWISGQMEDVDQAE